MTKSVSVISLIFLCFSLFETAILSNVIFLPAVPDFLLLVLIYFSIKNGRTFGIISGFCSGLIFDFITASPFGLNCLVRTITGYVFGLFNKSINVSGFFFPFFMGLSSSILKGVLLVLISFCFPNVNLFSSIFSSVFMWELLFNTVLTPFVFKFLSLFDSAILLSPEKII